MERLSTARKSQIGVGNEIWDHVPLLDVLSTNKFEEQNIDSDLTEKTQVNFYRGAPPQWLNFYTAEQQIPFIKRDGYDTLVKQIRIKKQGVSRTPTITVLHEPGSGGTTLAMQVLWDFRTTFRSAVLTGPTSDIKAIARQVLHLYTAGSKNNQNTVLLLLSDSTVLKPLKDSIKEELADTQINASLPVVIILNLKRVADDFQNCNHQIMIRKQLSVNKLQEFEETQKRIIAKYGDKHTTFHGFNIMQNNFSEDYVRETCAVFNSFKKENKPRQLVSFLSLLNAYVPGSYFLDSQCRMFLGQKNDIDGDPPTEERMGPFSDLFISFTTHPHHERRTKVCHPMVAQIIAEAGVDKGETANDFLSKFCRNKVSLCLVGFIKDMLTKRKLERRDQQAIGRYPAESDKKKKFSDLILNIKNVKYRESILESASKRFANNPFFPQALARFYYIELRDYTQAVRWAKKAINRDKKNSFIADTLGQVYKNHLKTASQRGDPEKAEILHIARLAIKTFEAEEQLAEMEQGPEENFLTNVSNIFNNRGLFGYLQVADILYFCVGKDANIPTYEVERKCNFFNNYLTYSRPTMEGNDPTYISDDVSKVYRYYFKTNLPNRFDEIMGKDLDPKAPEYFLRRLIQSWPTDSDEQGTCNIHEDITKMKAAYENTYEKYFRSRYLIPLFFFIGNRGNKRYIEAKTLETLFKEHNHIDQQSVQKIWTKEIFKNPSVEEYLHRCHGVVRYYRLYVRIQGREIQIDADQPDTIGRPGNVSFYLGFNIRGPVAFGIQYGLPPLEVIQEDHVVPVDVDR